ncbi:MAG: response regulator [Thermonemataceae bacterium]
MQNYQDQQPIVILMADDDPDDRMLTLEAFQENKLANTLQFVEDGEQLIHYLNHTNGFNEENAPHPDLILLDLNMPKKDGREALKEIKANEALRHIPVVVLTTSQAEEDIVKSYNLGVNSFISKPVSFEDLLQVTKTIGSYWFNIVVLPTHCRPSQA